MRTDAHYAGCPNLCSGHGRCDGARGCVCDAGFVGPDCGRTSATSPCPSACSGHGRCGADGACTCFPGYGGEACSEVLPSPTRAPARRVPSPRELRAPPPACPLGCSGRGFCEPSGACRCAAGFGGAGCEQLVPTDGCADGCSGHGVCEDVGALGMGAHCRCTRAVHYGWSGPTCASLALPAGCAHGCSGHGTCVPTPGRPTEGRCVCSAGFAGADCSVAMPCPARCHARGTCVNGQCECWRGWQGASCEAPRCPRDCSGHGQCLQPTREAADAPGVCLCAAGWAGLACDIWRPHCPNNCSGRGECVDGRCACTKGFVGDGCGVREGAAPSTSLSLALGQDACGALLCGGHGACVRSQRAAGTIACACFDGYGGPRCEVVGAPRQ